MTFRSVSGCLSYMSYLPCVEFADKILIVVVLQRQLLQRREEKLKPVQLYYVNFIVKFIGAISSPCQFFANRSKHLMLRCGNFSIFAKWPLSAILNSCECRSEPLTKSIQWSLSMAQIGLESMQYFR